MKMALPMRSVLDQKLNLLDEKILQLSSLVDTAIAKAMESLAERDMHKATLIMAGDQEVNELRYAVEDEAQLILATQQPTARDLRKVIAAHHEYYPFGDVGYPVANSF